jgi:hypothetical protein
MTTHRFFKLNEPLSAEGCIDIHRITHETEDSNGLQEIIKVVVERWRRFG